MENNMIQVIKVMIGHSSPKKVVMDLLKTNNNPIFTSLVRDLENGNEAKVTQFAENILKERGLNSNIEIDKFKNTIIN